MNYKVILFILAIFLPVYFSIKLEQRKERRERKEAEIYNEIHSRTISYTPPKSVKKPTVKKAAQFDPETVAALYAQADAEMSLALALDEKAAGEKDPVKHAVLSKNAAMHRTRSNQLSFKAFKLESSD